MGDGVEMNIMVGVRVRPPKPHERDAWNVEGNQISTNEEGKLDGYAFDRIYTKDVETAQIYEELAKPIVANSMQGINGTLFAYGQSGSGKTFTMMGQDDVDGLSQFAVKDMFDVIKNDANRIYTLSARFIEIYNEKFTDLLDTSITGIDVKESLDGPFLSGMASRPISSPEEIFHYMRIANEARTTGATNLNKDSSRSHAIVQIQVQSHKRLEENETMDDVAVRKSVLNLVDLAGSERQSKTEAQGRRLKEGCDINKSLLMLGIVISDLAQKKRFIGYRNSKLTRMLQPSLGGNTKTSIICTISLSDDSREETVNTLKFGATASSIRNKFKINTIHTDSSKLKELEVKEQSSQKEITALKLRIRQLEDENETIRKNGQSVRKRRLTVSDTPSKTPNKRLARTPLRRATIDSPQGFMSPSTALKDFASPSKLPVSRSRRASLSGSTPGSPSTAVTTRSRRSSITASRSRRSSTRIRSATTPSRVSPRAHAGTKHKLMDTLAERDGTIERQVALLEQQQAAMEDMQKQLETLQSQRIAEVEALNQQLAEQEEFLSEEHQVFQEALKEELAEAEDALAKAQTELGPLREKYDALVEGSSSLKEANEALGNENTELLKQLQVLGDSIKTASEEADALKKDLAEANSPTERMVLLQQEHEVQMAEMNARHQDELSMLCQQNEQMSKRLKQQQQQLEAQPTQQLDQDVEMTDNNEATTEETAPMVDNTEELQQTIQTLQTELAEVQASASTQIAEAKARISELEEQLESNSAIIVGLEAQLSDQKSNVANVEHLQTSIKHLEECLAAEQAQVTDLTARLEAAENNKSEAELSFKGEMEQLEAQMQELRDTIAAKTMECDEVKQQLQLVQEEQSIREQQQMEIQADAEVTAQEQADTEAQVEAEVQVQAAESEEPVQMESDTPQIEITGETMEELQRENELLRHKLQMITNENTDPNGSPHVTPKKGIMGKIKNAVTPSFSRKKKKKKLFRKSGVAASPDMGQQVVVELKDQKVLTLRTPRNKRYEDITDAASPTMNALAMDTERRIGDLTAEIKELQAELESAKMEGSMAAEALETEKEHVTNLQSQLQETSKELEEAREKIATITSELENASTSESSSEEMSARIEDLCAQLTTTEQQAEMANNELETIRSTLEEKESQIAELESSLVSAQSAVAEYEAQQAQLTKLAELEETVTEVNTKLEAANETIEQDKETIQELQTTLEEMQSKQSEESNFQERFEAAQADYKEQVESLTAQLEAATAAKDESSKQITELTLQLSSTTEAQESSVGELQEQLNTVTANAEAQSNKIEELTQELVQANSALEEVQTQFQASKEELESRQTEITELCEQLDSTKTTLVAAEEQVQSLTEQLDATKESIASVSEDAAKVQEIEAQVASLNDQIVSRDGEIAQLRSFLEVAKHTIEENAGVQQTLEETKQELFEKSNQLTISEETIATLNAQLEAGTDASKMQDEQAAEIASLKEDISNITTALQTAVEHGEEQERVVSALQESITSSEQQRQELVQQAEEAQSKLDQLQSEADSQKDQLTQEANNTRQELEEKIEKLTEELEAATQQSESLKEQMSSLGAQEEQLSLQRDENAQLQEHLATLSNKQADTFQQLEEKSLEVSALQSTIASKTAAFEESQEAAASQIKSWETQYQCVDSELKQVTSELGQERERVKELEDSLNKYAEKEQKFQQHYSGIKQKLAENEQEIETLQGLLSAAREGSAQSGELSAKIQEAEEEKAQLAAKLEKVTSELNDAQGATSEVEECLTQEIEGLKQCIDEQENELEAAKDELTQLQSTFAAARKDHATKLDALQKELTTAKLAEAENNPEELQSQLQAQIQANTASKLEIRNLRALVDQLKDQLKAEKTNVGGVVDQEIHYKHTKEITVLKEQISKLKEHVEELTSANSELKSKLAAAPTSAQAEGVKSVAATETKAPPKQQAGSPGDKKRKALSAIENSPQPHKGSFGKPKKTRCTLTEAPETPSRHLTKKWDEKIPDRQAEVPTKRVTRPLRGANQPKAQEGECNTQ